MLMVERDVPLRAHFKTWYDRCGVSVKRTVFYVGFLQFGSTLVSLRYPNVGFEMRSKCRKGWSPTVHTFHPS